MKKQALDYDIIVIGAGPAGLSYAALMAQSDVKIAVIDPSDEKALKNPPYDGREIALTHHSYHILRDLGVIDDTDVAVSMIKKAHVINGDSPYALKFDHMEADAETLGYMMSNQSIRKGLYTVVKKKKNIKLLCGKRVSNIQTDDHQARISLDDGKILHAQMIIGADGRMSASRRIMGISAQMKDLGRSCLVGVMKHDQPHHDTAYECFHYDRTLAVLPLNNGLVSVVITLPSDQVEDVLSMAPEDFSADITERFEGRVGAMELEGTMHAYPLLMVYASRFTAQRFALLGDAAVGMHPVTAHGFNLGLRGADLLACEMTQMIDTGGDMTCRLALERFAKAQHVLCRPLYHGTNALVKLYTTTNPAAKIVRGGLLKLGNILKPANALITKQLTG